MSGIPRRLGHALASAVLLAASAPTQQWTQGATTPPLQLGVFGDLLTADAQGAIGYDEAQGATVLLTGGTWSSLPANPGVRTFATLAEWQRPYLFGGVTGTLSNDLWRFDRAQNDWILLQPDNPLGPGPSPRAGAHAAAVNNGGSLVFFGGQDTTGLFHDTWVMADIGIVLWSQRPTPTALVGRVDHAMARAPNGMAILFGGANPTPLGDTWLFDGTAWSQHFGSAPPAAAGCRMTYDAGRDMTVLIHPNGSTWEWNGFHWRQVPAVGAPAWQNAAVVYVGGGVNAVLGLQPVGGALDLYAYAPSLAAYELTLDAVCYASGALELSPFERSLPILGQVFAMRASGLSPGTLFFGAYELSSTLATVPLGCGCSLGLTGTATGVQYVAGTGGVRDWLLPIANDPALNGVPVDAQGIVLGATPCFLMTTQRGTFRPGL